MRAGRSPTHAHDHPFEAPAELHALTGHFQCSIPSPEMIARYAVRGRPAWTVPDQLDMFARESRKFL